MPFRLVSPFTLKRRREGKDINRRENDYRDAEVAAQLLGSGEFTETRLPQGGFCRAPCYIQCLSPLGQGENQDHKSSQGVVRWSFPRFTQVFKDPCGQTALSVLSICPVPKIIAGMTEDGFVNTIRARHQERLMRRKLLALHYVARSSIGIDAGARSVSSEISFLIEKLHLIDWQVGRIEDVLIRLVDDTEEGKYLLSIRGLNYISVAGMLAELGSFRSYRSAKQLIKMAGSNPSESESAGKRRGHTPMSKKGRPALRDCAWTAVIPLLRHNPDFRAWTKRLRERPVHAHPLNGKEVVGAALNRLLRLAFTLVKKQAFYQTPQVAIPTS